MLQGKADVSARVRALMMMVVVMMMMMMTMMIKYIYNRGIESSSNKQTACFAQQNFSFHRQCQPIS